MQVHKTVAEGRAFELASETCTQGLVEVQFCAMAAVAKRKRKRVFIYCIPTVPVITTVPEIVGAEGDVMV